MESEKSADITIEFYVVVSEGMSPDEIAKIVEMHREYEYERIRKLMEDR